MLWEDTLARVFELEYKAAELSVKGHLMRAAEYHGRAADAARMLGDDNLVLVNTLSNKGRTLYSYCSSILSGVGQGEKSHCFAALKESITLLSENMTALERRRVAGTLLEGKCTELEEAWFARKVLEQDGVTGAELRSWAKLVGYDQYLRAAVNATPFLLTTLQHGAVSNMQAQQFVRHFLQALELMQLPRRHNDKPLPSESQLYEGLCLAIIGDMGGLHCDPLLRQELMDAKQRLERSGVLQLRKIGEQSHAPRASSQSYKDFEAALVNSMAAPGLRRCALASCGAKEAHPSHYKACAACRGVVYCCKEHQQLHWPSHKAACKAAKAAEAAAAGPSGGV